MGINENEESIKIQVQKSDLDSLIQTYLSLWINLKNLEKIEGQEILEKLLLKMQLNLFSLSVLLKGSKYMNLDNIFDIPSIFTLSRTLIENYLTIEYLFVIKDEKLEHTTRENRINKYKLAGKERFKQIDDIIKEQKQSKTKNSINAKYFGWEKLIEKSRLNTKFFASSWKQFSNYTHSEYMYIEEINNYISYPKAFVERRKCYRIALIIISQLITVIMKLFPKKIENSIEKSILDKRNLVNCYIEINKL